MLHSLPSSVIYFFFLPCDRDTYVNSTTHSLKSRVSDPLGVSHRTCKTFNHKKLSPNGEYIIKCKTDVSIENFKTLAFQKSVIVRILECMYIRVFKLTLIQIWLLPLFKLFNYQLVHLYFFFVLF